MKIEVSEEDLGLIKESLVTYAVSCMSKANNQTNVDIFGNEWANELIEKSNNIAKLLEKV